MDLRFGHALEARARAEAKQIVDRRTGERSTSEVRFVGESPSDPLATHKRPTFEYL